MRILELTITNFRGFKGTTKFSFSENFTVIAGVNGRGKTTVLDTLALVFSNLLPQISEARKRSKKVLDTDIFTGADEAEIAIKANCAGIPLEYSVLISNTYKVSEPKKLLKNVALAIKNAYGDPQRADDQAPLAVYYTTDRAGYRFPKVLPKVVKSGQAMAYNGALFNRLVDYPDFMARYRVAIAMAADETLGDKTFFGIKAVQAIQKAIEYFLAGFSNLQVLENPLRILVEKEDKKLDLKQLSDGERSLIALICDLGRRLALANPDLENPLEGAGVVLIDELELHLHPKWQLEIAEKLRTTFPNIQFIVTTHSPFVIQTAREGEVIKLDGELDVNPYGKSLEEISKFVMDVENTEYSPRIKNMRETARKYLQLAEEAKSASPVRKDEIRREIIKLLHPFSDNPAYSALLERKGMIQPED